MTRTTIDTNDELLSRVMCVYGLRTKREAVDMALRRLAGWSRPLDSEPLSVQEALELEGSGWDMGSTDPTDVGP
jgi:Arc/MetJ family transcription regulator